MESTRGMAMEINEAIARGDPFDVYNRVAVLNSVSVKDIMRVIKETFVKERSTVAWFLPGKAPESVPSTESYKVGIYPKSPDISAIPKPETQMTFHTGRRHLPRLHEIRLCQNAYSVVHTNKCIDLQCVRNDGSSHVDSADDKRRFH